MRYLHKVVKSYPRPVGITFHNAKQAQIISDFLFGVCFSRSYENSLLKITQINSSYLQPYCSHCAAKLFLLNYGCKCRSSDLTL